MQHNNKQYNARVICDMYGDRAFSCIAHLGCETPYQKISGKYKISLSFSSDLKHICLHLLLHLFENLYFLLDRRL